MGIRAIRRRNTGQRASREDRVAGRTRVRATTGVGETKATAVIGCGR